ncbi:helix-turn-helix domain-containing protein [Streptomyces sp. NBC_01262]|uniref:helix-turn-helix domain-containing protein n=1 Tax=Streptomyces sp. NBC_01262 TaxID=2903803 RepID=UPI002E318047|nr:helix-turn-helix domain-containing protein [Streptomyces sp. NBC_01262]
MSSGFTDGSSARKLPVPSPGRRPQPKRPKPPPTAYTRAVGPTIDLPPGHGAQVFPLTSKSGFIGESFSMDSLEFMRWAAVRYDDDRFVLVVLVTLMGSQQPGGLIETTHDDVAQHLGYSRPHISRAFKVLEDDGVLCRQRRGLYQLNPAASLRGGLRQPEDKRRGQVGKPEKVEQLDLLRAILEDPAAPEAFKAMAKPGVQLEARKGSGTEGKTT